MIGFFAAPFVNPRRRNELGLLVVGAIAVFFAFMLASLAHSSAVPHNMGLFLLGLLLAIVVVQWLNRRYVPEADPVIMPVVLLLNGIGYVMIGRLYPTAGNQQLEWTVLGIVVYGIVLAAVHRVSDLERFRYILLLVAMLLLVSPLTPVLGEQINGARLWVHFHSLEFQPIEIAKILLVIFFASYFIEKRELLTIPTRRIGDRLLPDFRAFFPILVAWALSLMIILAERDIGFSLILFVVFLTMLWITTGRWTHIAIGLILFALGTYFASHLLGQVQERISAWLNPWADPKNTGYQPIQGELAFGRGGLGGAGIGLGDPTAVPAYYSDYIFATLGEELGLFGVTAIVVAYILIVTTGIRAALRARSEFAKLCAFGLVATFGFQAFFIMAGDTRLLPLTGVTLPFVAAGGSSLIANYALVGLLMRISDESNQIELRQFEVPAWSITDGEAVIGAGGR